MIMSGKSDWISTLTITAACMLAAGCNSQPAAASGTAITNVNVIDGTGSPLRPGVTVLVEGERITELRAASGNSIPDGYSTIDGTDKYLIPGLWDMHVHLSKTRSSAMGLLFTNGVTSIRDTGGDHTELLRWRSEVRKGERVGPRIVMAGPYLESKRKVERQRKDPPSERVEPVERTRIGVGSPEEAREVVACLAGMELDFIKVRETENLETLLAIGEAVEEAGLKLAGHADRLLPEQILAARYDSVEHMVFPVLDDWSREDRMKAWQQFQANDVYFTPTLAAWDAVFNVDEAEVRAVLDGDPERMILEYMDPRARYLSRYLIIDWKEQAQERSQEFLDFFGPLYQSMVRNWKEMREAGVQFLAGSDTAVLLVYPGWGLHRELELLVSVAGMTPMEALESATRIPAEFTESADTLGTIEAGKIADLVLLNANPLADISNTQEIAGVMKGGVFFDRSELAEVLRQVDESEDQTVNDWPRTRDESDRHPCMTF